MSQFQLAARRFLKAFLAAGIAAVVTLFATGVSFTNTSDLKKFGLAALTAFISGGIMGIEKYLNSAPNVMPPTQSPPNP